MTGLNSMRTEYIYIIYEAYYSNIVNLSYVKQRLSTL